MKMSNNKLTVSGREKKFFSDFFEQIIADLPVRAQKIIKDRFGIKKGTPRTLESIGQEYQITRERVRQIIKEGLRRVREKAADAQMKKVEEKIKFTLEKNSGIITKDDLLEKLAENDKKERGAILFFLQSLPSIKEIEDKNEIRKSYFTKGFKLSEWREVINIAKDFLKLESATLSEDEFFKKISGMLNIDKNKFLNFLLASREITKNNFSKWGLVEWSEITPKGTREKSYLVMKEIGKPLHFRKVSELIDKYGLNKKKTHPQTVHNELIKDKRFVLIGRGTYALTEWGYKKGTVKDVLEDILSKSKQPLTKEEIIGKVLSARKVKKSTVMINLNNFFKKVDGNKYTVEKSKQRENNKA